MSIRLVPPNSGDLPDFSMADAELLLRAIMVPKTLLSTKMADFAALLWCLTVGEPFTFHFLRRYIEAGYMTSHEASRGLAYLRKRDVLALVPDAKPRQYRWQGKTVSVQIKKRLSKRRGDPSFQEEGLFDPGASPVFHAHRILLQMELLTPAQRETVVRALIALFDEDERKRAKHANVVRRRSSMRVV